MMFSMQQGHYFSEAAALNLKKRMTLHNVLLWELVTFIEWGQPGYTAGIWDKIIMALVLIEACIPGVIKAK